MSSTTFDTLTYAKRLQGAGFTPQQAEAQAEGLRAVVDENLATKQDIESVRLEIELVRRDMKEIESNLRHDMKEMESRIIFRLTGILVGGFAVVTAMVGVVIALVAL